MYFGAEKSRELAFQAPGLALLQKTGFQSDSAGRGQHLAQLAGALVDGRPEAELAVVLCLRALARMLHIRRVLHTYIAVFVVLCEQRQSSSSML